MSIIVLKNYSFKVCELDSGVDSSAGSVAGAFDFWDSYWLDLWLIIKVELDNEWVFFEVEFFNQRVGVKGVVESIVLDFVESSV